MYKMCVLLSIILLTACSTRSSLAPVVELKWQPHNNHQTTHTVKRGETLYAIAFRYDQDYRQLAAINHLHSPYALRVGQVLRVRFGATPTAARQHLMAKAKPISKASYSPPKKVNPFHSTLRSTSSAQRSGQNWFWPVNGRIIANFIPQQGKKGIDIAGRKGEMIHAARNGIVAYAGSGLSGYGNLIIIKHDNQFLTAYGNNSRNIVKEGQKVKAGQVIAEIGVIDRRFLGVHFEIRKAGQPVNPLSYLKRR